MTAGSPSNRLIQVNAAPSPESHPGAHRDAPIDDPTMEDDMAGNEQRGMEQRPARGETAPTVADPFGTTGVFGNFDRLVDGMMRGLFLSPFERRLLELPEGRSGNAAGLAAGTLPKAELSETEKGYELSCELPGLAEADIELTLRDGEIQITGKKETRRDEKDTKKNYHFSERSYGSFQRSFRLPQNVDEAHITALFENGVLTVTLPKTPAAIGQQKKIPIAKR
jgi:HSP20 family protein